MQDGKPSNRNFLPFESFHNGICHGVWFPISKDASRGSLQIALEQRQNKESVFHEFVLILSVQIGNIRADERLWTTMQQQNMNIKSNNIYSFDQESDFLTGIAAILTQTPTQTRWNEFLPEVRKKPTLAFHAPQNWFCRVSELPSTNKRARGWGVHPAQNGWMKHNSNKSTINDTKKKCGTSKTRTPTPSRDDVMSTFVCTEMRVNCDHSWGTNSKLPLDLKFSIKEDTSTNTGSIAFRVTDLFARFSTPNENSLSLVINAAPTLRSRCRATPSAAITLSSESRTLKPGVSGRKHCSHGKCFDLGTGRRIWRWAAVKTDKSSLKIRQKNGLVFSLPLLLQGSNPIPPPHSFIISFVHLKRTLPCGSLFSVSSPLVTVVQVAETEHSMNFFSCAVHAPARRLTLYK